MKAEIISFEEFAKLRKEKDLGRIVATSGGFDPVHAGHLYYIYEAGKLGDTSVCIVNGDNFLRSKKGKPFILHKERCEVMSYVKGIHYVIPYETTDDHSCIEALDKLRPHVFVKSADRSVKEDLKEWPICQELGIEILIIPPAATDDIHSSKYLDRWFVVKLKQKFSFIVNPYNKIYHFIATRIPEGLKKRIKNNNN